jgi:Uma2 family endonuclease
MAESARRLMTPEEFFAWQEGREELYELVDGVPVLMLKMMTGTSVQHDRVTVNVIVSLANQLRGSRCRPTTDGVAVRTKIAGLRRPDVTVECAEMVRDTYEAREPRLVVEVLSPSTMNIDRIRKLDEYKRHPTLDAILIIDTRRPAATLYRRSGDGWDEEDYAGLDAAIDLPTIGARLTLREVFDGVGFEELTPR